VTVRILVRRDVRVVACLSGCASKPNLVCCPLRQHCGAL